MNHSIDHLWLWLKDNEPYKCINFADQPKFPCQLPYINKDGSVDYGQKEGEIVEARDTLGACLGFSLYKYHMDSAPKLLELNLGGEIGDYSWPAFLLMLDCDGTLRWRQFFHGLWHNQKRQYNMTLA